MLYILNGYASLATNDDWALRGMLVAPGIYNTFIMSYPLSYFISHLYDFLPSYQWYSVLLSFVMGVNFYFWARYIAQHQSYVQKLILFVLALLWLTFLWFNMSITVLTVTTMISAIGLIQRNLLLSFAVVLLAFLLRSDIMLILIPYYLVAYFILRDSLKMAKQEFLGLIVLIGFIFASLMMQKQDQSYEEWLAFNKARSAIVDSGVMAVEKDFYTKEEWFCVIIGWWQDSILLPSEKIIAATPTFLEIVKKSISNIHLSHFINTYKFKHWLWLLLAASIVAMLLNYRNRRALFIPFLVIGVILLLIIRDVERVTVPLILLWAYVMFELLKSQRILSAVFILLFTYIFYYYASSQYGYRYFKENTALQKEARDLIAKSNKACEVSIAYPTSSSGELITVFQANYIFHENSWLQINREEILPGGWLSRHKFFYETRQLSDKYTQRAYPTYYSYLIDDRTAFFGSKRLVKSKNYDILLHAYDRRYLKDKPQCRHKAFIIEESKHFAISQIKVDCNTTK